MHRPAGWVSVWSLAGMQTAGKKAAFSSDLGEMRQVVRSSEEVKVSMAYVIDIRYGSDLKVWMLGF